jgi:hypothetical protein
VLFRELQDESEHLPQAGLVLGALAAEEITSLKASLDGKMYRQAS